MTRRHLHGALLLAGVLMALAGEPRAAPEAQAPSGDDLLHAIDFAPTRADLDASMTAAQDELIARATDVAADPGERLRSIRALSQYPGDPAHTALLAVIAENQSAFEGTSALYLRGALEALGEIGTSTDVDTITPYLDTEGPTPPEGPFEGRDVRAAAATALGVIGSPAAVAPLHARLAIEQTDQVKFAITEALRAILGS